MNLKEQNYIIKHVTSNCSSKIINTWQSMLNKLPGSIFAFARKALIFCLPNRSNLFRWKMVGNNECGSCKRAETQLHALYLTVFQISIAIHGDIIRFSGQF